MACFVVDFDGTMFYWGTNSFVPGAKEALKDRQARGDQLLFTTRRPSSDPELITVLNDAFGIGGYRMIFNVDSPRVLINDDGAIAVRHHRDSKWNYDFSGI